MVHKAENISYVVLYKKKFCQPLLFRHNASVKHNLSLVKQKSLFKGSPPNPLLFGGEKAYYDIDFDQTWVLITSFHSTSHNSWIELRKDFICRTHKTISPSVCWLLSARQVELLTGTQKEGNQSNFKPKSWQQYRM